MKNESYLRFIRLVALGTLLLLAAPSMAQQNDLAQDYFSQPGHRNGEKDLKPYWKVYTDYKTNRTKIRFFGADSQMVYEEELAGQYVVLTRRNVRELERILASLTSTNRVAGSLKSTALNLANAARQGQAMPGFQVNAFPSYDGYYLHLYVVNPARESLKIVLKNKRGEVLYEAFCRWDKHHYKFDMTEIPAGDYRLMVIGNKQQSNSLIALRNPVRKQNLNVLPEQPVAVIKKKKEKD